MKVYTGIIHDMGPLTYKSNSRGGIIEFIRIGNTTLRRIRCPRDVFSFQKTGMNAILYVHSLPLLGNAIIGVKDADNDVKFMALRSEVIASCIMRLIVLGLLFIVPSLITETWSIYMLVPVIAAAIPYFDYLKAKTAK